MSNDFIDFLKKEENRLTIEIIVDIILLVIAIGFIFFEYSLVKDLDIPEVVKWLLLG